MKVSQRGFTLLEVMVALAVFATLAAAVLSASQFVLRQSAQLEERLFGAWLIDNQLSELLLQGPPAPGRLRLERRFAQRDWVLTQAVERTADPRLLKVELSVTRAGLEKVVQYNQSWTPASNE